MLLFDLFLMYLPLFVRVLCWSLFWYAFLYVLSSFAIILTRKRELFDLLLLSFGCLVIVNVLKLFFTVPWVGLQLMTVVFPDHTHFFSTCWQHTKVCIDSNKTCRHVDLHDVIAIGYTVSSTAIFGQTNIKIFGFVA